MAMQKNIRVSEEEDSEPIQLPLDEDDGSLRLSLLKIHFPNAVGLRYHTESDTIRGVKLSQGKLYPPENGWGSCIYYCMFLKAESAENDIEFNTEHQIVPKSEPKTEPKTEPEPEPQEIQNRSDTEQDTENEYDIGLIKNESEPETECIEMEFSDDSTTPTQRKFVGRNRKMTPSARRPHRCDICGNCFTQQSHMLRHRRIHTGEKPFACDQCSERFSRSDKLKLHYDKCHSSPSPMMDQPQPESATLRDRREKKPKALDTEYEWGPKTSPVKTKHLTVKFKKNAKIDLDNGQDGYYSVVNMAEVEMEDDEPEIKKEVIIQPTIEERTKSFECTICCKPFAKKNQLQRHVRIHTGERPFKCHACVKSFTRIDALKRHLASVGHQKQKETNPDADSEEYETLDAQSNGMDLDPLAETEDDTIDECVEDGDEMNCDIASFAQVTYANLENIRTTDEDDSRSSRRRGKENFCYQCNHLFTNKFNYTRHMKSHEKEEKAFKCSYCHYVFRRQSHLTRHVLIHTGEKPFQCTQCEERFSRSDKLKLHVKRTHTGGSSIAKSQVKIEQS